MRLQEEWTLTVTHIKPDGITFRFRVEGSKTGLDGEGISSEDFVSKSRRLTIGKDDWAVKYGRDVSRQTMPVGFQCRWRVVPMFRDVYVRPERKDPTLEYAVTVAQGLGPGTRKIQIVPEDGRPVPIEAIRVYRSRRSSR